MTKLSKPDSSKPGLSKPGLSKSTHVLRLCGRLAIKDLLHDRWITLCLMIAVAAITVPILLLLGIKTGVVETMRARMLSDPQTLEVQMLGNWNLSTTWFDAIKQRPELLFVMPLTRSLSAQVNLVKTRSNFLERVEIVPTGIGDPVLSNMLSNATVTLPTSNNEVVLSHTAAKALSVEVGDDITASLRRRVNEAFQEGKAVVTVIGIAPETVTSQAKVFTTLSFLENVEWFLDVKPAPIFDKKQSTSSAAIDAVDQPAMERYARARIYARSLEDVAPLAEYVRSTDIEVSTRAAEIDAVLGIDRAASFVAGVIIWATCLGGAATMVGFINTSVDRKQKELAVLRLLGFSKAGIALFPVVQSVVIGVCGLGIAFMSYVVGSIIFNKTLGAHLLQGEFVSVLPPELMANAIILVLVISAGAATLGGLHAAKTDPATPLRSA